MQCECGCGQEIYYTAEYNLALKHVEDGFIVFKNHTPPNCELLFATHRLNVLRQLPKKRELNLPEPRIFMWLSILLLVVVLSIVCRIVIWVI